MFPVNSSSFRVSKILLSVMFHLSVKCFCFLKAAYNFFFFFLYYCICVFIPNWIVIGVNPKYD